MRGVLLEYGPVLAVPSLTFSAIPDSYVLGHDGIIGPGLYPGSVPTW